MSENISINNSSSNSTTSPICTPSSTVASNISKKRKKKLRNKTSWVWNHFKTSDINLETDMILCRKCNENVNYDGNGPTLLAYHLKSKHKIHCHTVNVNNNSNNENIEDFILSESNPGSNKINSNLIKIQ